MSTLEMSISTQVLPNGCGHIVLKRSTKYNALSFEMLEYLLELLLNWREDDNIKYVLFSSECKNAFCAGGDIEQLADSIMNPIKQGFSPWQFIYAEYRLDLLIARYTKPIISLVDGYIMGGGCGISINSTYNIITEKAICAMPECSIYWFPDCLFCYYLHSNMTQSIGRYIGLTGAFLDYKDMIYVNFAKYFVKQAYIYQLKAQLLREDIDDIESFLKQYSIENINICQMGKGEIEEIKDVIDDCFGAIELNDIIQRLKYTSGKHIDENIRKWAVECHRKLLNESPLSLKVTMKLIDDKKYNTSIEKHALCIFNVGVKLLNECNFYNGVKRWRAERNNEEYNACFPYGLKHNHESCDLLVNGMLSGFLELDARYSYKLKYDENAHMLSMVDVKMIDRPCVLKIDDISIHKVDSKL